MRSIFAYDQLIRQKRMLVAIQDRTAVYEMITPKHPSTMPSSRSLEIITSYQEVLIQRYCQI